MAKRIGVEEIKLINEAYLHYGTYAAAARAVGCSPSTVKKYVVDDYKVEPAAREYKEIVFAPIEDVIQSLQVIKSASCLTPREKTELKSIWKDMNF